MALFWFVLSTAVRFTAIFVLCVSLYRVLSILPRCFVEASIWDQFTGLPWCLIAIAFPLSDPPRTWATDGRIALHELVSLVVASIVTVAWTIRNSRRKNSPYEG
ncbi:MAG: hypothetical protein ACT4O6_26260 [Reyranella sp.]